MKEVANAGKFLTLSDDLIKDVRTATDDCIHWPHRRQPVQSHSTRLG
jgi:hypothetical protein